MATRETVLVVDDDANMRHSIRDVLDREGYQVVDAENGARMHELLAKEPIDLILLDLTLPDEDGIALARDIRSRSNVPIIMVTGRNNIIDKVVSLEVGSDDYITKPFHPRELTARIGAILRRCRPDIVNGPQRHKMAEHKTAIFDGWELDLQAAWLTSPGGKNVNLTTYEFQVLEALIKRSNTILSRDQILDLVMDREWAPYDRSIDVLIGKVRKKLSDDSRNPRFIRTIRCLGYMFIANVKIS